MVCLSETNSEESKGERRKRRAGMCVMIQPLLKVSDHGLLIYQ